MLLQHNLISGWRNILKYKTQNIISVLCLSVGTVFFAVVIWFVIGVWNTDISVIFDDSTKSAMIYDECGEIASLEPEELRIIQQLPSVKELNYANFICDAASIKDDNGNIYNAGAPIYIVSPNWCKMHKFKSATTGKRFDTLKNGTLLMVDRTSNQYFSKELNPVGFEVQIVPKRRVDDVIDTSASLDALEGYYLVDDGTGENHLVNDYGYCVGTIYVTVNDDSSFEEFEKEMKRLLPDRKIVFIDNDSRERRILFLTVFFVLILLGSSVLVIGLSGYLKMQIQLFALRSKELALRRCNGAKPLHLFMLLVAELLIIFLIVTVMAILMTLGIAEYLLPRLAVVGAMRYVNLNIFDIFNIETAIVIVTFLVSVIISWMSVRKIVSAPLGETAGRSYSSKTAKHSVMQTVQYFVATMLMFIVTLAFMAIYYVANEKEYANSPDYYKEVAFVGDMSFDCNNCQPHLQSAERIGKMKSIRWITTDSLSRDLVAPFKDSYETGEHLYSYEATVLTPQAAAIMHMKVEAESNGRREYSMIMSPVYAPVSEAEQIARDLNLDYKYERSIYTLPSGVEYVRLGYSHVLDNDKCQGFCKDVYIIRSDREWNADDWSNIDIGGVTMNATLIQAKPGKYNDLCEELNNVAHQLNPSLPVDYEVKWPSAYETWFKELIVVNLVLQLCYLLTFISIISVVLSVFSSVSLETRGRQKEVAIRKVNGAKTKNIVLLFCRYHIVTLSIAFVIALVVASAILVTLSMFTNNGADFTDMTYLLIPYGISISVITIITFCTIWRKIYEIAHLNPSEMIKKE